MTTLLTGATGFLGSRLLLGLLVTRGRHVTVLGRGTASELRSRVLVILEGLAGGGIGARVRSRLRCVGGDVTRPWLGLAPAVYGRLAREAEAVWHCAGDIALTGERERLFRANVHGTERILEFAGSTPPDCPLVHMSTVAVAGGRRRGVVAEEDLTDAFGFETHYDESKYRAETSVRDWARRLGRPAVVLRPGIVASDDAHREGMPKHPLRVLGDMIDALARNGAPGIPPAVSPRRDGPGLRLRLRVPADAEFNIVPDGYATEAMLRIGHDAAEGPGRGVRTFHVVHPEQTPMRLITEAVEAHHRGLTLDCVADLPDPTPAESFVAGHLPGFLSYCHHRRVYDRRSAVEWTGGLPDPAPLDRDYLARAMGFTGAVPHAG